MAGLTVPVMSLGILLVYLSGSLLPWQLVASTAFPAPLLLALSLLLLWDSPQHYLSRGRPQAARAAWAAYRGKEPKDKQLVHLQQAVTEGTSTIGFAEGLKLLVTETKYLRPFLILNGLFFFMLFSGKFAIEFYAVDIFTSVGGGAVDAFMSAVIIAFIQLGGSLVFLPLVKHLPRQVFAGLYRNLCDPQEDPAGGDLPDHEPLPGHPWSL